MEILTWLRKLFHREHKPNPIQEYNKAVEHFNEAAKELTHKVIDVSVGTLAQQKKAAEIGEIYRAPLFVPKIGFNAERQDISKFMKHGRQLKTYRKSIKAKIRPEED